MAEIDTDLPYQIRVSPGSLHDLGAFARAVAPAHQYAVITDSNVGPLYGTIAGEALGIEPSSVLAVPAGEASKSRGTWGWLTDQLIERKFGRDSAIVAVGGGVIGDLAGFVAATYMRGVPVVHVPTTLLAMIDSSIGGKTGVDTVAGKNLVGAFHAPAGVLVDPQLLATLPIRELRTGFAEALKHGVIANRNYFDSAVSAIPEILAGRRGAGDSLTHVIVGSIDIKSRIVSRDEYEAGVRKTLNFGHTIGHAVEQLSDYALAHGEAVAIGMALESRVAERAGIAEAGTSAAIEGALGTAGLGCELPAGMDAGQLLDLMRGDKKVREGLLQYALPRAIGEMAGAESGWTVAVDEELVREVLG